MRARSFQEQVPFTLISRSGHSWGGMNWVHGTIHGMPLVRRAAADASRLMLVTAGRSEVSWKRGNDRAGRLVEVGAMTYLGRGHELESLVTRGDHSSIGLELDPARLERWTGDDLKAGALFLRHLPAHIVDVDQQLLALFLCMEMEGRQGCPSGTLYAESLSLAIASYLWGRFSIGHRPRDLNGLSASKLVALKEFVRASLHADITLDQLAAVAGMSPKHLCRCFRQTVGVSPYQYVLRLRIDAAREALRFPDQTVTDIASSLGFSSASHFSRSFRKATGVSPSQYRRGL